MPKIDCSKKCRMTALIRESKFCNQSAEIAGETVKYGCVSNMSGLTKEEAQYLSCELWDLGLKESCNTCQIVCVNNSNPDFSKTLEDRKKLEKLVQNLKPNMMLYGVSADQVEQISKKYTGNGGSEIGKEAIKMAEFANSALGAILSGKNVDLSFFTLYAKRAAAFAQNSKNIKKK